MILHLNTRDHLLHWDKCYSHNTLEIQAYIITVINLQATILAHYTVVSINHYSEICSIIKPPIIKQLIKLKYLPSPVYIILCWHCTLWSQFILKLNKQLLLLLSSSSLSSLYLYQALNPCGWFRAGSGGGSSPSCIFSKPHENPKLYQHLKHKPS